MNNTSSGSRQRCEICKVEIEHTLDNQDLVHFSRGNTGGRAKLWARVCQYLRTDEQCDQCLNQDANLRGEVTETDYYADAPIIDFPSK
uniref:Uncharacterized protein n=1 Tax=Paulinella longichromatophora TaxID=1708747 RepID=A0A2H4ZP32_9EUKA|nr:hypothetical protein PLO_250 [Paulinella longichromatophora]